MRTDNRIRNLNRFIYLIAILLLLSSFTKTDPEVGSRYFLVPTLTLKPYAVKKFVIKTEEGSGSDTLYQNVSEAGIPVSYYRKIEKSVCFDNKCRLLKLNLYWNITGRYLGFELPTGEFLSKTDHEPFELPEYHELNRLLNDSLSLLRDFSFSDMMPKATVSGLKIDGVTAATSKDIADYVIKGAGYTTFTMWHLIYGDTRKKVTALTREALSPEVLFLILGSEDEWDQYWAMNELEDMSLWSQKIEQQVISLINDEHYNLALKILNRISAAHLTVATFQNGLLNKFNSGSYALKNSIVIKLLLAKRLEPEVKLALAKQLKSSNGELFINLLALFKKHDIYDLDTCNMIAGLLENKNPFIANKAYLFLKESPLKYMEIHDRLKEYENALK